MHGEMSTGASGKHDVQVESESTDPPAPESPGKGWEKDIANLLGNEAPNSWPSSEKESALHDHDPSDIMDINSFLGLGKEKPLIFGELASQDEHEKVLSYLGISKTQKSSMLVTLGLDNAVTSSTGMGPTNELTAPDGFEHGTQSWDSEKADASKTSKSTLNVGASPFCPAKFRTGSEEGPKLNPAAVPFVPGGVNSTHSRDPGEGSPADPSSKAVPAMDSGEELSRAQAAVRHYQNLYTGSKEELQACNKTLLKEKEISRRAQDALEQRAKDIDHLRMELQAEAMRSKQAGDQLAALQAEMGYYKKLMEQIQGQIQITWAQFMSQLQQEKLSRQASEEAVAQLQAALQLARLEAEQSALRAADQQSGLKEAQLLAQQQQERAEAKEKEATFYRTMYNTVVKQVESSHAAVRASIELEKQTRQEAEVKLGLQAQDPPAGRQGMGKPAPSVPELDPTPRSVDTAKEQSA